MSEDDPSSSSTKAPARRGRPRRNGAGRAEEPAASGAVATDEAPAP
jgi:hypothetical protein